MSRIRRNNFFEYIEENPIKSLLSVFSAGFALSSAFFNIIFLNKIENIKDRYEDKIEDINRDCEQKVQIAVQDEKIKNFTEINPNSKEGQLFLEVSKKIKLTK